MDRLTLDYASPGQLPGASRKLVKAIFGCWLLPLSVGISIFFAWVLTRWVGLAFFGLASILIGTVAAIAGAVMILVWLIQELAAGRRIFDAIIRATLLLALLVSNFGAAWIVIRVVDCLGGP